MKFYSTNDKELRVTFREAVMKGLSDDGGLFMPETIPAFDKTFIENIDKYSLSEIAFEIISKYTSDDLTEDKLHEIVKSSFTFESPVKILSDNLGILELFHGPTLAFKDFGARFMARTMGYFAKDLDKELNILVATSGDTGSAVASGFYNVEGINVFILYPSGKVSSNQEKQLTTYGNNIIALEIDGTFDDCQKIVKTAFLDNDIKNKLYLSSANSINIARLLPQSVYYAEAFKQLKELNKEIVFSVPSGNLGNITAGLIAKKMGLPVSKFISATNMNNVFTEFIESGKFNPRKSVATLSNAMDVGNPSNLSRIIELYDDDLELIKVDVDSSTYNDETTKLAIKEVSENFNYTIDPHGAIGYLALKKFYEDNDPSNYIGVVLETAHPAKFKEVAESVLGKEIIIPERLDSCLHKEKNSIKISKNFEDVKKYLLS
ncbi:MAG: threonine synthase [Melioribacteraceae bacterium]|nr:threonine synthase [Melioribacteraceae bacterium]